MPEVPGEVPPADGLDAASDTAVARGSLDVPEWVSEMRRLYVEPKTRARMREEGVIAPQKRQRGLAGVRSRRSAARSDDAGQPAASALPGVPAEPGPPGPHGRTEPHEHTEPVMVADERPAVSVPPTTDGPENVPSGRLETAPPDSPETPPADALETSPVDTLGDAPPTSQQDVSSWLSSYLTATGHGADDEGRPAEVLTEDFLADAGSDPISDQEAQPAVPARSLAELAGLVEPEDGWPQPFGRVAPPQADTPAHDPLPGRPGTVPAVTLSWREAEVFDMSIPEAEADDEAIVVEPPSQVVAESRIRHRHLDLDGDTDVEGSTSVEGRVDPPPPIAPVPDEAPPVTRASARAASGPRSGRRPRLLAIGLVLVVLAVVALYFLLDATGALAAAR